MQYKVPQNIDMEDKIVGPFTMKQFVYLLVCGGIIYAWWNYLQSNYVNFSIEFAVVAIPIGLLGFALALVKINDRPFEYFLLNVFRYLLAPKNVKWKDGFKEEAVILINKNEKKKEQTVRDTGNLDELAKQLEDSAAALQEKQAAVAPKKTVAQIQQEGTNLNISVKEEAPMKAKAPQPSQQTPPAGEQATPATQTAPPPAAPKPRKKILGLF